MANIKRLCYYHNKDLDGFFSGAVVKHKYPEVELRGWDYKDPVPDFSEMEEFDEVILIDITFPLDTLLELGKIKKLTVIDHHISFIKQVYEKEVINFEFVFDDKMSACELGFQHYFGYIPEIVELVGKYDTWRANGTPEWETSVLPMKYWMYGNVNKPEDVNTEWFVKYYEDAEYEMMDRMIQTGKSIMNYENKMNESKTRNYAFEREAYGLRALCMNTNFFSSETMKTMFDPEKHDIMIGFAYTGNTWSVSLRSVEGGADVSVIARERGGGGHKGAAGFEVKTFEDIFK